MSRKAKAKEHWVLADPDSVTVMQSKKTVYPVNLIVHGHSIIEQIEILKNENYINVKLYGKWARIYLPSERSFEISD